MDGFFASSAVLILLTATLGFLVYRLRLFSDEDVTGRFPFVAGGLFLSAATGWQVIKETSSYADWFVANAYVWLDVTQLAMFMIGILMTVIGLALYSDYWQVRSEDIETREQKLTILDDLQRDARQPFHLLELLEIAIKEIITHTTDASGAVFLVNRARRELVLTSSVGLTKQETATLEHYPLDRNLISQALDVGRPLLGKALELLDQSGRGGQSRWCSALALPLISGNEKIGCVVLLSEQDRRFGSTEISYLAPVVEWLAEKIRSARLDRDLSSARRDVETWQNAVGDITTRLQNAIDAFGSPDINEAFCRSLVGMVSSSTVHLVGVGNGSLQIYGGSEPILNLSENYQTALVEALDKDKPLIINQEAVAEDGRAFVAQSSLIYPVVGKGPKRALVFRRESTPIKVSDLELKMLATVSHLAGLVLDQKDSRRLDLTRRKGLDRVLKFLKFDQVRSFDYDPQAFIHQIAEVLAPSGAAITFAVNDEGNIESVGGLRVEPDLWRNLTIGRGEGAIGRAADNHEVVCMFGRQQVAAFFDSFTPGIRDRLMRILTTERFPGFVAICPLVKQGKTVGLSLIFLTDVTDSERGEFERLLKLAAGLYSTALTVNGIRLDQPVLGEGVADALMPIVNRLNNHLSAVIGNGELVLDDIQLPPRIQQLVRKIVREADQAAREVSKSLSPLADSGRPAPEEKPPEFSLEENLNVVLSQAVISGNLHMVGGRPREIHTSLAQSGKVTIPGGSLQAMFEDVLNRFAAAADDEDILTVSTYVKDSHVYLDVSRHRKNFPPVENVAGFGKYEIAEQVFVHRPSDTFLKPMVNTRTHYAYDRFNSAPSYLSFKFPLAVEAGSDDKRAKRSVKILAIDDQQIILDLISAMCRSMGYEVVTANSGDEGIKAAAQTEFDLVLTDFAMPGQSGIEVARAIHENNPGIPIVLITGWEASVDPVQLERAGISQVLYKPFRMEHLTEMIQSIALSRPVL